MNAVKLFHDSLEIPSELDQLVDRVVKEVDLRMHEPTDVPRQRTRFRHRPRPNTAIIARAAQRAIENRS
jgi:hypothetical protein